MSSRADELLTPLEVADELKISRETARKLMATGKLPYVVVSTGGTREMRRVRRDTLDQFKRAEQKARIKQELADVRHIVGATGAAAGGSTEGPW